MGHFKSFMLGIGVAYAVYYLNKKDETGRSVIDKLIEDPDEFIQRAKLQAMDDVVSVIKKETSKI